MYRCARLVEIMTARMILIFKMTKVSNTAREVINENRTIIREGTTTGDIVSTIATIMTITTEVEGEIIVSKAIAVANRIITNLTLRTLRFPIT